MKIQPRPLHHVIFSKSVRRSIIAVVSIVVLVIGAAVLYTWLMSRNGVAPAVEGATTDIKPRPLLEKTALDPNAAVGVSVQTFASPLRPGSDAEITIKTYPEAVCTITAKYNEVASTDPGLLQKTADEYGVTSWTWFVESKVPEGTWPVDVTCAHHEKSGMVRANLAVKK